MGIENIIIVFAFIANAHATEISASHTGNTNSRFATQVQKEEILYPAGLDSTTRRKRELHVPNSCSCPGCAGCPSLRGAFTARRLNTQEFQPTGASSTDPRSHSASRSTPSSVRSAPLGATQVDSLDTEVDACAICLQKLQVDVDRLPCGHGFHASCKTELVAKGYRNCPLCRASWVRPFIISSVRKLSHGSQEVQLEALVALLDLAQNTTLQDRGIDFERPGIPDVIREEGGIEPLLKILTDNDHIAHTEAAVALNYLTLNGHNRDLIVKALVALLAKDSCEIQARAAGTLLHLAQNSHKQQQQREYDSRRPGIPDMIRAEGGLRCLIDVLAGSSCKSKSQEQAAAALSYLANYNRNRYVIIQALIKVLQEGGQKGQARAAVVFSNLANENKQNQDSIRKEGAIQALIKVLAEGGLEVQTEVAATLSILALNSFNRDMICDEGGIEALIKLLHEGSQQVQANAATALGQLTLNRQNRNVIIQALISCLHESSQDAQAPVAAALWFPALVSENPVLIIRTLIKVLQDGSKKAQAEAAAVLGVLARRSQNQDVVREEGGIQLLMKILSEGSEEAKAKAAGALRNLADKRQNQIVIQEAGGIQALIAVLHEGSQQARAEAAAVLRHLAVTSRSQNGTPIGIVIIQAMIKVLQHVNHKAQAEAAVVLRYLAHDSSCKNVICENGGVQALMEVLREGSHEAKTRAAAALLVLARKGQHRDVISQALSKEWHPGNPGAITKVKQELQLSSGLSGKTARINR